MKLDGRMSANLRAEPTGGWEADRSPDRTVLTAGQNGRWMWGAALLTALICSASAAHAQGDPQVIDAQRALERARSERATAEARERAAEAAVRAAEAEAAARVARQEADRLAQAAAAAAPVGPAQPTTAVAGSAAASYTAGNAATGQPVGASSSEVATLNAAQAEATRDFAGLKFGAGVSVTFDIGKHDRVREAELVNGLVRVSRRDNTRARIMLESHYFFLPNQTSPIGGVPAKQWGWGPFIALQPGTEEIIEAAALGFMVGFRRSLESKESFNLGVGIAVDPSSRILADGVVANQLLPPGETEVRFLEREQIGVLMLTSFSF